MTMKFLRKVIHQRWRRDLSPYLDGRLGPRRQVALERHLAGCILCQEELAGLRNVIAMLRQVPQVEVPRSFALSQRPSVELPRRTWYFRPVQYATAVAAVLLVAVMVGDLATGRPAGPLPTEPGVADTMTAPATEATAPPQPLSLAGAEKALEQKRVESPPVSPEEGVTLHTWLRGMELGLGGLMVVLVSIVAFQWWRGHRRRHG